MTPVTPASDLESRAGLSSGPAHAASRRWFFGTRLSERFAAWAASNGRRSIFECVGAIDSHHSFRPVWQPPWISRLVPEDHCHLNGLAMEGGEPAYVTCVSRSDANEGWRDYRRDGGLVVDVRSNEIVCDGLSMPHSPRLYQDRLWLLDSGSGELGYVDRQRGLFEPVAFCPGYARGLAFLGDFALVGLSKPRGSKTFTGLALDERLAAKGVQPRCALQVIDLRSGDVVHELRIEGVVEELYDVAVLPGVQRPMALGFKTDEIRRVIVMPPDSGAV